MRLRTVANPKLNPVFKKLMTCNLPMTTAYKIKKIAAILDAEAVHYQDLRKKLLDEFGKKNELGELVYNDQGYVEFDDDNYDKFKNKHEELLEVEVRCETIKVSELADYVQLSAADLIVLDDLLTD